MTRIPDAVAVASLETHRLIIAVPNAGPADVSSNLPGPVAASVLRQIAAVIEQPGRCSTALATGQPCPIHDATDNGPASPSAALIDADPVAAFARGMANAPRPDGLDALLDAVAGQLPQDDPDRAARGLASMTTPTNDGEEQQPRRVLAEEEYDAVYRAAVDALGPRMRHIGHHMTGDVVDATLAAVGILTPPPEPDGDTCSALFPDPSGTWWQCLDVAGHDTDEGHDAGDWTWPATAPNAIAPRPAE
ncbi:hypothetical protein OOK39_21895 [Streptomyces sp. NBC_00264]|uniref:hypothetical protein n=1 Tax=unclassified Streptomyces TaxID=2593676 RepID=UPI00224F663E|nr:MULTISPECIES: hypothetical protein [unclassified Streptomyces]MCX5161898.1 hypothetical protein [Streptomyces sp. NBC_00305]MCX5220415.1 hypothetical protein [Streptomyces sp. NBC_00264]